MKVLQSWHRTLGQSLHVPVGRRAFEMSAFILIAVALTWIAMVLLPYGWQSNADIFAEFRFSLYSFTMTRNENAAKEDQHITSQESPRSVMWNAFEERESQWLSVTKWAFCHPHQWMMAYGQAEWCNYVHKLQIASVIVIVTATLGVCFLLMGVMTGFYFHYIKPKEVMQKWAAAYLITASVAFTYGLVQYFIETDSFSGFQGGESYSDGLGNLIGESESSLGFAFFIALTASLFSWIASWFMIAYGFRFSWEEHEQLTSDEDNQGGYGAMFQGFQEGIVHQSLRMSAVLLVTGSPVLARDYQSESDQDDKDPAARSPKRDSQFSVNDSDVEAF